MDLHISVIADFKTACPDVEVVDWCLSGHAWVMKRKQEYPKVINPSTWRNLNMKMIAEFQDEYDSFLKSFDGFIVGFASSFAMIYEKYNKPILMLNAVRYDIPFCWTKDMYMLLKWKECLDRLNSHGLLTIVSNNKADQLYTLLGSGMKSHYIPSLCLYTNTSYSPTKPTFLCYNGNFPEHHLITYKKDLPHPHEWSDVTSFQGVINFPYEVSLMSCFEHYFAGCPLFFPSKTYWKANPSIQSISAYWNDKTPSGLEYFTSTDNWIELADMYDIFQSPNTYYFDSVHHLFKLIEGFEYKDDREYRQSQIVNVKQQWKQVIQNIITNKFWKQYPRHLCYNRLPLLANVVYDIHYAGSGVAPQHNYSYHEPLTKGDIVFVKTDLLSWFLINRKIDAPITLVTGVSDLSPSKSDCEQICKNSNILKWIGCNIEYSHPKIIKVPIGVGELERMNGNHEQLVTLHKHRVSWDEKLESVCVPYHSNTSTNRHLTPTLPKLPFEEYMKEISKYKFVVCQKGNGIDTHRVCEVLLMGSVPIITHSGLDDMYSQWPVLLVDNFEAINTSSFQWDEEKYQEFLDIFWLRDAFKDRLL